MRGGNRDDAFRTQLHAIKRWLKQSGELCDSCYWVSNYVTRNLSKVIAKNRANGRAFYIISAQVVLKIAKASDAERRAAGASAARRPLDSPRAAASSAVANAAHNINLHNCTLLVHILYNSSPARSGYQSFALTLAHPIGRSTDENFPTSALK